MGRRSSAAGTVVLGLKMFVVALLAVAVVTGAALAAHLLDAPQSERPGNGVVDRGRATFVAEQRDRYARLAALARLLSREPALQEVLRGNDALVGGDDAAGRGALTDLLFQRREELGYDFALVLDADGRVVAANEEADLLDLIDGDVSNRALVSRGLEEGVSQGVWRRGDGRLAHASIEWVTPDFDLLGYVVVGLDLSEVLALEIQRTSGAGTAFLADQRPGGHGAGLGMQTVASTFDGATAERLTGRLLAPSGDLAAAFDGDDNLQGVEVDLGGAGGFGGSGGVYEALLTPLRDAAGELVGAALIAAPVRATVGSPLPLWTGAGAGAALLLALVLAFVMARGATEPVRRLSRVVEMAPREGFARRPEPRRAGMLAPLATALGRLFRDLQEGRALTAAARSAAQAGSSEMAGDGGDEATRERLALVAVDLKRYAGAGAGEEEPRRTATRWRWDVARAKELVTAAGGRLQTVAGHRLLATFAPSAGEDPDRVVWRAVVSGAALLHGLAEGESAFDQGEPPAVAVVFGRVTRGSADAGRPLLVGSAVQLAESVLRESTAGTLMLPRAVHSRVEDRLSAEGVEMGEQRGLLSPQPLFTLSLDQASRLAAGAASGFAVGGGTADEGDGAGEPGEVLHGRFEVVERVASSSAGDLLRVQDRELGRPLALKRLTAAAVVRPGALGPDSLDNPLDAARRFSHPGAADLYEFGEGIGGGAFFAREWVVGVPLHRVGELVPAAALALGRGLAAVLAEVHGAGLFHGRVKPGNLILVPGEGVRLTDLGVALVAGAGTPSPEEDRLLAPEQRDGAAGDMRSDVFAAGALLARLMTGRWWTGADGRPGGDLPGSLEAILRRCVETDPDERYAHAAILADELDGVSV